MCMHSRGRHSSTSSPHSCFQAVERQGKLRSINARPTSPYPCLLQPGPRQSHRHGGRRAKRAHRRLPGQAHLPNLRLANVSCQVPGAGCQAREPSAEAPPASQLMVAVQLQAEGRRRCSVPPQTVGKAPWKAPRAAAGKAALILGLLPCRDSAAWASFLCPALAMSWAWLCVRQSSQ